MQQRRDAVLEAGEVQQVDGQPQQPGDEPGEPQLPDHGNGTEATDRRHRALVEVVERLLRGLAGQASGDLLGGVLGALDRDLRDARQVVEVDHVADHEHLGIAGQREVGVDADPSGPVERRAALLGQRAGQRRRLDAGGPDLGHGRDLLGTPVLVLHLDAALVDVGDHRAEQDLHAEPLELGLGLGAQLGAERRQHLARRVDEDDAGVLGVDRPEVAPQRAVGELGDLAGHLDPGRPRAHDDEGQQVVDVVAPGRAELGHLERPEDAAPQLERVVDALHARRELGEPVVAEVALPGAGRDDQRVVRRHGLAPQDLGDDRA